jgi:hypothetical protein
MDREGVIARVVTCILSVSQKEDAFRSKDNKPVLAVASCGVAELNPGIGKGVLSQVEPEPMI